jgi:hypothetical protein
MAGFTTILAMGTGLSNRTHGESCITSPMTPTVERASYLLWNRAFIASVVAGFQKALGV